MTPSIDSYPASGLGTPVAPQSRRGLLIGGALLSIFVIGAIAAVLVWRSFVGSAFASAEAVPPNADFVVTFDLLQVRDSDRLNRLVRAFSDPMAAHGLIEDGDLDLLETFDNELARETGFTLTEDVIPWIGRSVTFAVWFDGFDEGPFFEPDSVHAIGSVSVRDRAAATAFMNKLAEFGASESGGSIERSTLGDGDVVTVVDGGTEDVWMYVDDDLLLIAPSRADVAEALSAREGDSILDTDSYRDIIDRLPSDRLVAIYMGTDWLRDLYSNPFLTGATSAASTEAIQVLDEFEGFGAAATLLDEGVMFDLVYSLGLTASGAGLSQQGSEFVDRLPASTLAFMSATIEEGVIDDAVDSLRDADPAAFGLLQDATRHALGVDLFSDVLPAFGREVIFAAIESTEGAIAIEAGADIGIVFGIGVVDRPPVADVIGQLNELSDDFGLEMRSAGDVTIVNAAGSDVLAYALTEDSLVIGTSADVVGPLVTGSDTSVTKNERYETLDKLLPGDGLQVYADLQGLFDQFEWNTKERDIADPLQGFGVSSETKGNVLRISALLMIKY